MDNELKPLTVRIMEKIGFTDQHLQLLAMGVPVTSPTETTVFPSRNVVIYRERVEMLNALYHFIEITVDDPRDSKKVESATKKFFNESWPQYSEYKKSLSNSTENIE